MNDGRAEEGLQRLREVASTGNPQALFILGDLTWSGNMAPQDPARGRLLFEYAAAAGHTQANILVTNLLANGVAGRRDWPLAMERLAVEGRKLPDRQRALELVLGMNLNAVGDPKSVPKPQDLSEQPYARMFEQIFTESECDYLMSVAEDRFEPSMVYNRSGELVRDTIRTSDGAAFHWLIEDPAVHAINRRVAVASGTAYDQGEPLQALRYSPGQEYRPHFDFVDGATNQRLWTALMYLNDEYEGGQTAFVRTSLKVRGKPGDMLLFRNALNDGALDELGKHAGMPVTAGTKYLSTRWIRERRWIP
ncbi:MAG: 2OG-Fe(II) oxygenase [Sphingomonas sp.]|nr:2OG-Fe(II) oxygenase [Sphingomonas sp.]